MREAQHSTDGLDRKLQRWGFSYTAVCLAVSFYCSSARFPDRNHKHISFIMFNAAPALRRLPPESVSKIRSLYIINSLAQAAEELVANALDAQSTSIAVTIDAAQCTLTVDDNGCGMSLAGESSLVVYRWFPHL